MRAGSALAAGPLYELNSERNGGAPMKLSDRVKPISYLKAHASEIVRTLGDRGEPDTGE